MVEFDLEILAEVPYQPAFDEKDGTVQIPIRQVRTSFNNDFSEFSSSAVVRLKDRVAGKRDITVKTNRQLDIQREDMIKILGVEGFQFSSNGIYDIAQIDVLKYKDNDKIPRASYFFQDRTSINNP
ncbi:hypothetical protein J4217_03285 [Candidatus Pacearchaeota archaeon]|nr:hypothetical protein [Candidatus Pacearchaeota archaeon]